MLEFGKSLTAAREAKGLTIAQIAESTHLMTRVIEDLEAENFSRIAAPIYGRGFIRIYCNTIGIDPKPYVDEYMAILNGDRDTPIIRKQPAPVAEPPPPQAETASTAPAEPVLPPEPNSVTPPPAEPEPFKLESQSTRAFARYASPLYDPEPSAVHPRKSPLSQFLDFLPTFSPRLIRPILVICIAAAVLIGVFLTFRALYRMTMTAPEESKAASAEAAETDATLPRRNITVAPLYID